MSYDVLRCGRFEGDDDAPLKGRVPSKPSRSKKDNAAGATSLQQRFTGASAA